MVDPRILKMNGALLRRRDEKAKRCTEDELCLQHIADTDPELFALIAEAVDEGLTYRDLEPLWERFWQAKLDKAAAIEARFRRCGARQSA